MTDAVRTTTLETLIQRAAFRLGDLVMLETTRESSGDTELYDAANVPMGNEDLTRRQMIFSSGSYRGQIVVITATDASSHGLTYEPPTAGPVQIATTAYVINKHGMGYVYSEYKMALNMAIDDSYPLARTPVAGTTSVFDSDLATLSIPSTINEVYEVQYQDDDGNWWPVSRSYGSGYRGWQVNQYENTIIINDDTLRSEIAGLNVRVLGEGKHPALTTYDSTTKLHPDYLVARCCYHLCLMGMDRDITGTRARQVGVFADEAEKKMTMIRTQRVAGSAVTRSS
jgi:hypothetical protein